MTFDVLNLGLSQTGAPDRVRVLIWILIGACAHSRPDDEGWCQVSDRDLAIRIADDKPKSDDALRSKVRRYRKALVTWQNDQQLQFVEVKPGKGKLKRDEAGAIATNWRGQKVLLGTPTAYRLPVMDATIEIVRDYQAARFQTADYLERLVRQLQEKLGFFDDTPPIDTDMQQKLRRARRKIVTDIERFVNVSVAAGEDRDEVWGDLQAEIEMRLTPFVVDDSGEYLN